jgi:hypothetical protein
MAFFYRVHGLVLASDLECPELLAVPDAARIDVHIRLGHVPESQMGKIVAAQKDVMERFGYLDKKGRPVG